MNVVATFNNAIWAQPTPRGLVPTTPGNRDANIDGHGGSYQVDFTYPDSTGTTIYIYHWASSIVMLGDVQRTTSIINHGRGCIWFPITLLSAEPRRYLQRDHAELLTRGLFQHFATSGPAGVLAARRA